MCLVCYMVLPNVAAARKDNALYVAATIILYF